MESRHTGGNFKVIIAPIELTGNFSAVSGLNAELECEEYIEGGTFRPVYLPKGLRYGRIVLQRGTATLEPLALWFDTVRAGSHVRYPMVITMMDNAGKPVKIWTVLDAMPVKIDYGTLDAMSGQRGTYHGRAGARRYRHDNVRKGACLVESITAARNISGLEPMSVLHGIAPLCVPMSVSGDFADEVGNRAVPRIVLLWERLGLFYMLEQPQTAPVSNTRVTVNNFTAQMIFRLCSFSHTDRLIERYQPGSVFPENIRRASQENVRMIRSAEMRRVFRALMENSRYTEEVGRVFRLIFEKETGRHSASDGLPGARGAAWARAEAVRFSRLSSAEYSSVSPPCLEASTRKAPPPSR